jgi:hypothetical protein
MFSFIVHPALFLFSWKRISRQMRSAEGIATKKGGNALAN